MEELSAEKFRKFTDVLFDVLGKSDVDVNRLIEAKEAVLRNTEEYKNRSDKELRAIAYSEAVAEMMEPVLTDTDAISRISQKIKQQDRSLWGKIKDFIKGIVEKLKAAYRDMEPDSAIARLTRETVTNSEAVLDAFSEAAADAVLNYNLQEGQKNNAREGVQFSTRENKNEVAQMREVSSVSAYDGSLKATDIVNKVSEFFESIGGSVNNKELGTISLRRRGIKNDVSHGIGREKAASFMAVPDILQKGKVVDYQTNWKGRGYDTAVIAAPIKIAGVDYLAGVCVKRTSADSNFYVHEVLPIKNEGTMPFNRAALESVDSGGDAPSINSILLDILAVKGNFLKSSRSVQEAKSLVALHNLTEDKFLKTLELGGFPMPSIAITKADIPHTNFGDITVVFGKDTIDPKGNRKNTVYSADAWTPVVPRIEYEVDRKAENRVYDRLGTLKNQVAQYFQHDLDTLRYNIEDGMNREGGEEGFVQRAIDNYGLKAAYLEEQGKHVDEITKQTETVESSISDEQIDKLLDLWDAMDNLDVEKLRNMPLSRMFDTYGEAAEKAYPGITKSKMRFRGIITQLLTYLRGDANNTVMRTVTDGEAMKEAVDAAIDRESFESWTRDLFRGIEKSRGIYNGKDRYTPAGSLKSFKATHVPATLDGIVKAMSAENGGNTKNVSGFFGVKTLRAATAEQFKSIADMHKLEGRLQNLTEDQVNQIQDNLGNRLYALMDTIDKANTQNRWSDNSLIRMDSIGEMLVEIGESGRYSRENIQQVFAKYSMQLSDETAQQVIQLLYDISQMPVNIFEAKPARAVDFDEIKMVLVPDTASQKLLGELDSRGIPYRTYEAGNEELRHQMVQDMEDVRFSARNPQAQVEAENERLKTELEYLKKLVQIQKRGNKDFTLDRNSLKKAARALMNANNVKGNAAELAEILDRVYRYAGTEQALTWEGFAEQAGEAADWLMENREKERDPYAQQILDAVAKRRVSLNEAQIGEIEYRYGSLSEFKKAIKGSIILDQNANTSLDQLWQELSGEYPGTFDAGTTDADMPGAFADIVDELRNSESANEAERQYYADEERNQLIRQVYDGYWDVDPVQSVSDKAKKEIDQLKAEHREALRELKAENRQLKSDAQSQVAAAVREYRQQNNAMTREMKKTYERQLKEVQKGYEKFRSQAESLSSESTLRYQNEFYNALMGTENMGKAKVPELRKKFRELAVENSGKDMDARKARQAEYTRLLDEFLASRDIGKLRTTIQEQRDRAKAKVEAARVTEQRGKLYRAVNEINRRLLNPTKTLYVPDSLAPAVTKFMQGLTEAMESPKNSWNVQGALETLQGQYQKLTQMNEGVFTQEYNQGILDLLDNAISAVGGTDFNKLSASQIEDVYSAVRSVLTAIRNENKMFAANLNKTYAEAAAAVLREESALPNRKPTTGAVQDKAEKFGWNQLKPVYAMMRLGSDTLLKQYDNLRAGEDKWQRVIAAARAYGLGIMAKYHYDQWNDSLMKLDTETGTVELSLEERMSLYAYARREQAFEHLTKGGFVLSDKNTRTVKNRFGIETEQT